MKPERSRTTRLFAAVLLAASIGGAQDAAVDDLSLSELLDIKLQTGSFLDLDLARSPLSMTVIDRDKIEVSGARHLSELLEIYVPGFQYMFNKWNGILWGMRGVANDRNTKFIVLVNGHKMNTEARDGFFQETSLGLFGEVERIEVLRGPAGLVYGSGAIAGIVNIVTREATRSGAEILARAGAYASFGNGFGSCQGTVLGKLEKGTFVATAGYQRNDGVGNGVARLYGNGSWPFPSNKTNPDIAGGVPVDGSAQADPGSWKGAVDFNVDALRIYARATHEVQEAGGMFLLDPWPGVVGTPDSTTGAATVDGRSIPYDDPFWSGTESWNTNRREYVADNILVDLTYNLALGSENSVKLHGAFDGNTDRIQREARAGYESNYEGVERNSFLEEAFGERRYTLGATWQARSLVPGLQIALGAEQRFDDIGDDLSGRNSQQEKRNHQIVSDILYANTAVFTEGWYDVRSDLGLDFGLRWDGHTRTLDDGGTLNGKLAGVWTAAPGHIVKLIFQTSSNNGSADNYEFNRNNFDDNGMPYTTPHFEKPTEPPGGNSNVIYGVTSEQLHKLKPERIYSFELTSTDDLGHGLGVSPSVSYNMVRDLFAWNQTLFRVVNVGQYDHLDLDLQVDWKSDRVEVGANHALQIVVNTDVDAQAKTFTSAGTDTSKAGWYDSALVNGVWNYFPLINGTVSSTVNPVKDQITADGTNFLSLNTNLSKFWIDVKPLPWVTLHTDARVFWGLAGREDLYAADESKGYNDLKIATDPSVKWDVGLRFALPDEWTVGVTAYDILGSSKGSLATHAVRWQQMGASDQRDLYAVDLRAIALDAKKSF